MIKLKIILQSKFFYLGILLLSIANCLLFEFEEVLPPDIITISDYNVHEEYVTIKAQKYSSILFQIYCQNDCQQLKEKLIYGQKIKIKGEVSPLKKATIPNTFDQKKYYNSIGIHLLFTIKYYEFIPTKINKFDELKEKIVHSIKDPYHRLFLLGKKEVNLSSYQNLGVSHLFSLSGMHLSVVLYGLKKIFGKCKYQHLFIFCILGFYLLIIGIIPSFFRAVIFYYLRLLFKKLKVNIANSYLLILTFSIMNFFFPYYLFNIGYQLSFVVTFGILYHYKKTSRCKTIFWISLISSVYSLPIIIQMNYELNIISILYNLLFVPYVSFYLFPLAIFSFFVPILYPLFYYSYIVMEQLSSYFEPFCLLINIPKLSILSIIIYYAILLFSKSHFKGYFFLFFFVLFQKINLDSNYSVYFLDVGQGDCSLMISPYQKEVIMIDTGGNYKNNQFDFKTAEKIKIFLKSKGISKISLLILSHGDIDHALNSLYLKEFNFLEKVIINQGEKNFIEEELSDFITSKKDYKSHYFELIHYQTKLSNTENDNSNVLKIIIQNYSFLFLGDISSSVEKELLKNYHITTNVVKIAHHGSKNSSNQSFLQNLHFEYALISVGKNNYGHPHPTVLENLQMYGKTLQTNLNGSVLFKIKKNKRTVLTYQP